MNSFRYILLVLKKRSGVLDLQVDFLKISFFTALLSMVLVVWFFNGSPRIGIDDANIFFNYAENIVKGRGITYSNNGIPVEGCTSMLWLFICAFNFLVGCDERGVFLCSIVLLLSSQIIWLKILDRLMPSHDREKIMVYCGLILSCPAYITWMSITLMDTVLWGGIIAWMAYVLVKNIISKSKINLWADSIPFVLSVFARPEAIYVVAVSLSVLFAIRLFYRRGVFPVVMIGVLFSAALLLLTAFRMWYFGFPLPNTFYAKVSPSLLYNIKCGIVYAGLYISSGLPVALFASFSAFFLVYVCAACKHIVTNGDVRHIALVALWCWTLLLLLTPVLTGGDHFELHRFFQPFYPAVCVLLSVTAVKCNVFDMVVSKIPQIRKAGVAVIGIFVLMAFGWTGRSSWAFWAIEGSSLSHEFKIPEIEYDVGVMMSELFKGATGYPVVGVITAGGIARGYEGVIVDLMGLNNIQMAHHSGSRRGLKNHAAFEPEIFPELKVDVLKTDPEGSDYFLKGLCGRPEFGDQWCYGTISRGGITGYDGIF